MSILKRFVFITFCLLTVSAWASAQTVSPTPAPTPESKAISAESTENNSEKSEVKITGPQDFVHAGDVIDVDVVGTSEFDWRGSLSPEGFISGVNGVEDPVFGLCQTVEHISAEIEKGLSKFLRNPVVLVRIIDRSERPLAIVNGAVRTPQRFRILRKVRLNEIIVLSGGLNDKTGNEILIMRQQKASCVNENSTAVNLQNESSGRPRYISKMSQSGTTYLNIRIADLLKGKPEANPLILSGDVVSVPETDPVYIIGGVGTPRMINSRSVLTLSRAIASAGGFLKNADRKHIYLYRRTEHGTEVIEFDFTSIHSNASSDPELRAFDIVEVGQAGRARRQTPPIVQLRDASPPGNDSLPLRIIE